MKGRQISGFELGELGVLVTGNEDCNGDCNVLTGRIWVLLDCDIRATVITNTYVRGDIHMYAKSRK
jgi:hypothetical protein